MEELVARSRSRHFSGEEFLCRRGDVWLGQEMLVFPGWDIFYLTICWGLTLTTSTLLTVSLFWILFESAIDDWPASSQSPRCPGPFSSFYHWRLPFGSCLFCCKCYCYEFVSFPQVPSGELFRRGGRYLGFTVGCACQVLGSFLGGVGMASHNSVFLYLGCALAGLGQVFLSLSHYLLICRRGWDNSTGAVSLDHFAHPMMSLQ
jgi:hypothetical protein